MSRRQAFREAALLILAVLAALYVGEPLFWALAVMVPVVVIGAAVAAMYLQHAWQQQPPPRSKFFAMLVSSVWRMAVLGAWVGYLAVARVLEQVGVYLPSPPRSTASPITAMVIVLLLTPPIVYAWNVFRVRRNARHDANGRVEPGWDVDPELIE